MDFLAQLAEENDRDGIDGRFVVWDGVEFSSSEKKPDLICGDERLAKWLDVPCLRFPVRELGVLAARVLVNMIRSVGVRPTMTLVRPPLLSSSGEPILMLCGQGSTVAEARHLN